jgi:hypothetical protein
VFVFKSCFFSKFARSENYIALFVLPVVSFESKLILMALLGTWMPLLMCVKNVGVGFWAYLVLDSISHERTNGGSDISLKIMIVPFHNTHQTVRKDI